MYLHPFYVVLDFITKKAAISKTPSFDFNSYIPFEELRLEASGVAVQVTFTDKSLNHYLDLRPSTSRCLTDVESVFRSITTSVNVKQIKLSGVSGFYDSTSCVDEKSYKCTGRIIIVTQPYTEAIQI